VVTEAVAQSADANAGQRPHPPAGDDGATALLSLQGIGKRFGALVALDDVSGAARSIACSAKTAPANRRCAM
jgi:hypothetical protein